MNLKIKDTRTLGGFTIQANQIKPGTWFTFGDGKEIYFAQNNGYVDVKTGLFELAMVDLYLHGYRELIVELTILGEK